METPWIWDLRNEVNGAEIMEKAGRKRQGLEKIRLGKQFFLSSPSYSTVKFLLLLTN